jgi:hypothetical protein
MAVIVLPFFLSSSFSSIYPIRCWIVCTRQR